MVPRNGEPRADELERALREASAEADEKTDWHVSSCPAAAVRDAAADRASWSQPFDKWGRVRARHPAT